MCIVIDAQALLESYPNPSQNAAEPTDITGNTQDYVYVLISGGSEVRPVVGTTGGADMTLTLALELDQIVSWGATPMAPTRNDALLVDFELLPTQNPLNRALFESVQQCTLVVDQNQPNDERMPALVFQTYMASQWQCQCIGEGDGVCAFTIAVIEPGTEATAHVAGYFQWRVPLFIVPTSKP